MNTLTDAELERARAVPCPDHAMSGATIKVRGYHTTVGKVFRANGNRRYLCTHWRTCGYHMAPIDGDDDHVHCVSESAIQRTYWPDHRDDSRVRIHPVECRCSVCREERGLTERSP